MAWLVERMRREGHSVALLSGELSVEERLAVLDRYRDGLEKILISTNVLSRGIDVEQVTDATSPCVRRRETEVRPGDDCGELRPAGGRGG